MPRKPKGRILLYSNKEKFSRIFKALGESHYLTRGVCGSLREASSHLVVLSPAPLWRHGQRVGAQQTPVSPVGLAKRRLHPIHTRLRGKETHTQTQSEEGSPSGVSLGADGWQPLQVSSGVPNLPEACPRQEGVRSRSQRQFK